MIKKTGFTLIELLVVISLIAILGALSYPLGTGFLTRNNLNAKTDEYISALYSAQNNAMSAKENDQWSVTKNGNEIILFKGSEFTSRNTDFDQIYKIPSNLTVSQFNVTFNKNSGYSDTATTIEISNEIGSKSISINEVGTINTN